MLRALTAIGIVLVMAGTLNSAPRLKNPDRSLPIGKWRVEFANGVVQTSTNEQEGPAHVTEPGRTSPGKWIVRDRQIVIVFDDDRTERWKFVDKKWVVEHWCPSAAFPNEKPVVGIAAAIR